MDGYARREKKDGIYTYLSRGFHYFWIEMLDMAFLEVKILSVISIFHFKLSPPDT